MSQAPVTIFHNPACGTSNKVLAAIRERGVEPRVVEYLKAGWTREGLSDLLTRMGAGPRDILRTRGAPDEAVALVGPEASDAAVIDAMVAYPKLVERPIVQVGDRAVLARPPERLAELLQP